MSGEDLKRSPPFRAEHVGSLLRPSSLHPRIKYQLPQEEQVKVEDQAIKDIVQTQLDCGLHGINDGEFRRHVFWGNMFQSWHGIQDLTTVDPATCRSFSAHFVGVAGKVIPGMFMVATDKIKHPGYSTFQPEIEYLQRILPEERWGGIKLTLPSPHWCHLAWRDGFAYSKSVYANDAAYFKDIAAAYRQELDILYKAGVRNIQFDDPNLTIFCSDEDILKEWNEDKANTQTADAVFQSYIGLYNDILALQPADLHVGIHLCRGNSKTTTREGGYDRIAETLFQKLNVDTFYLEYDNSRSGGFEPLRKLPRNKNVILGVVTTKEAQLEDESMLKQRIFDAADTIAAQHNICRQDALRQIGISPQCGFSSAVEYPHIGHEEMVNKLKLIRRVADAVWPGEP